MRRNLLNTYVRLNPKRIHFLKTFYANFGCINAHQSTHININYKENLYVYIFKKKYVYIFNKRKHKTFSKRVLLLFKDTVGNPKHC